MDGRDAGERQEEAEVVREVGVATTTVPRPPRSSVSYLPRLERPLRQRGSRLLDFDSVHRLGFLFLPLTTIGAGRSGRLPLKTHPPDLIVRATPARRRKP